MRALSNLALLALLGPALAACTGAPDSAVPPDPATEAYSGITAQEKVSFLGTEPFWGGEVAGTTLRYTTPEQPQGSAIAVSRFAGRGGLSFAGQLGPRAFDMMVTPAPCSDGMSERSYPFVVTLRIGEEQRDGCGWTDRQPFRDPPPG